ncbi:MAG: hypothetical protein GXN98_03765, partial [Euryarchaeota archaeon]|nr:hypothetical protein [Euryarchaeota archaeon]
SNASFWGIYSICGLLMRLRGLYRFESGMEPWERIDTQELMKWLDGKERLWRELAGAELRRIEVDGESVEPMDVEAVERHLPENYCYGAGYSTGMNPSFFLAELKKRYSVRGFRVSVAGRELVRDLLAAPAMSAEGRIYLRMGVFREYLWEKVEEARLTRKQVLLQAFELYGVSEEELEAPDEALDAKIRRIVEEESYTLLAHELGEQLQEEIPAELFRNATGLLERVLRSLSDLLADTHPEGRLEAIVRRRSLASLAFYVAELTGMRREMFPELAEAYRRAQEGDWSAVQEASRAARERAVRCASQLREMARQGLSQEELRARLRHMLAGQGINL